MEDKQQNPTGAKRTSVALSSMKENRQRQTSTTPLTQTSKPKITQNSAPQNNNKNDSGWVWFVVFFIIGFVICSML